ncbi:hypothetical protein A2714_01335 [Candidatus Woesebacteria bacterium RIFCSPHIGHO2_01_FULL_38_9]|uniref:DUF4446 domain-containing protein n=2 Tax=Candidatus Woeseibacteriota TaxID=1752722 RepID=A0A1F7XZG6_9BACT|nr:MAG: hypothetical protein A2714_01335 [Candidatus Woesebacteria bacterium RIFCSPHIGHO2_01_FULL_38_9]OGM58834.1 MAG: hypothetical protein A3A75_06225 [Candidatus Woesebacteria bacterium RIFCSPLOWO2_01_FULL_39_10]
MELVFLILIAIGIWLLVISIICFWVLKYFRQLSYDVNKGNLISILERVLEKEKKNSKNIEEIVKRIIRFEEEGKLHVQKVGLIRFNPFKELGGEHSFALALLDGNDEGVLVTGLHTRERTRIYIKSIKKGKSDIELSAEEKKAVSAALKRQ